jgi:ankyrin repeat protein
MENLNYNHYEQSLNKAKQGNDESDDIWYDKIQDASVRDFIHKTKKNPLYFQSLCDSESAELNLKTLMNFKNSGGSTILYYAVDDCNLPLITKLLEIGADVNAMDRIGKTPIMTLGQYWSKYYGTYDTDYSQQKLECSIFDIMIDFGAKINLKCPFGETLLMQMTENSCAQIIHKLISEHGAPVDEKDDCGKTAFMIAAQMGRVDIMIQLLNYGANINAQDLFGNTALMHTISWRGYKQLQAVALLLKQGADIDLKNSKGKTASNIAETDIRTCDSHYDRYRRFALCNKCSIHAQSLKLIAQTRHRQNKSNRVYSRMFLLAIGDSNSVLFNLPLEITIMIFDYLLS